MPRLIEERKSDDFNGSGKEKISHGGLGLHSAGKDRRYMVLNCVCMILTIAALSFTTPGT